jgi:hypothetical protein
LRHETKPQKHAADAAAVADAAVAAPCAVTSSAPARMPMAAIGDSVGQPRWGRDAGVASTQGGHSFLAPTLGFVGKPRWCFEKPLRGFGTRCVPPLTKKTTARPCHWATRFPPTAQGAGRRVQLTSAVLAHNSFHH